MKYLKLLLKERKAKVAITLMMLLGQAIGTLLIPFLVAITGIRVIRAFGNEKYEEGRSSEASYVIMSLQSAIAGAERVFEFLDEEEAVKDNTSGKLTVSKGRVKFKDVKFGYTPERTLIKNLNLEVNPNEMVAIVGPTGGGKSTLINLIMRFYELNGGLISIDGVNITEISRSELRRQIGMVLQDTWLFEGTIAENIAYGKMDATREEIIAAAKAACYDHFIRTLPQGYDTVISSETSTVSHKDRCSKGVSQNRSYIVTRPCLLDIKVKNFYLSFLDRGKSLR